MNGKDHNLRCKCGNKPKFFCQTHKELICYRETGRHPCLLVPIEIYMKKLNPSDLQLCVGNTTLDDEKQKVWFSLEETISQRSSELTELVARIEGSFKRMITSFSKTWLAFLRQDLDQYIEELQLSMLQKNKAPTKKGQKISISKNLSKEVINRSKDYQTSLGTLIDQDYFYSSLLGYLKCMESQATTMESAFSSFVSLDLRKQEVIRQQLDNKIGFALLYEGKDLIRKYFFDAEGDSGSKFNALYLAYMDQSNEQNEGMRRFSRRISNLNNLFPRGSINLGPQARASTLQMPRYSKAITEILGEIDFCDFDDSRMPNSQADDKNMASIFKARTIHNESDDYDFEIDDTMIVDAMKQPPEINLGLKLHELITTACQLMDHAIFDFNCQGFFDPNFKGSVNLYLDKFGENMSMNLLSLKNTFNRL